MNAMPSTTLAGQYRLSAIINGIAGLFLVVLGGIFLIAWLVSGLAFHQLLLLSDLFVTSISLVGCSTINFAVMAYHIGKWRRGG